jgi:hypothetical protein
VANQMIKKLESIETNPQKFGKENLSATSKRQILCGAATTKLPIFIIFWLFFRQKTMFLVRFMQ